MFQPFRQYPQGQGLGFGQGLLAGLTINHNPRKFQHLGQPAAICFLLGFNSKFHGFIFGIVIANDPTGLTFEFGKSVDLLVLADGNESHFVFINKFYNDPAIIF